MNGVAVDQKADGEQTHIQDRYSPTQAQTNFDTMNVKQDYSTDTGADGGCRGRKRKIGIQPKTASECKRCCTETDDVAFRYQSPKFHYFCLLGCK